MIYAVGYAAFHPGDPSGATPPRLAHEVRSIRADDDVQALDVGRRYARIRFPASAGWSDHTAVAEPSTSVLPPEEQWA